MVLSSLCTVKIKSSNIFQYRKISSTKLELFQRKETGKTAFLIGEGDIRMKTLELSELNFWYINVKVRDCFININIFLTVSEIQLLLTFVELSIGYESNYPNSVLKQTLTMSYLGGLS